MSDTQRAVSLRAKTQGALGRIEALEQDIPRIVGAVNEALTRLNTQLSETVEILNALVALSGEAEVASAVSEARKVKSDEAVARAKASLADSLAKGTMVATTTVTEQSILVGVEKGKDGTPVPPGRAQLSFATLLPEFKEKLLGQGVGFSVETPLEGSFELQEIYEAVEPSGIVTPDGEPVAAGAVETVVAPLVPLETAADTTADTTAVAGQ